MLKNYLKVSIRNIARHKAFSFINVFGLALAMSVCLLIILMVADKSSYDRHHAKGERIYRILSVALNGRQPYSTSPLPLGSTIKTEYPIAEQVVTLMPVVGGDAIFNEKSADMRGYIADPDVLTVFDFQWSSGIKATALSSPFSAVISTSMADRLFPGVDPIGKTFEFFDRGLAFPIRHDGIGSPAKSWGMFTVTGIVDETAYKSHLSFDVLVSSSTLPSLVKQHLLNDDSQNWEWYFKNYTYVLLKPGITEAQLQATLDDIVARRGDKLQSDFAKGLTLQSQKVEDISLTLTGNDTAERLPIEVYYFLGLLAGVIMLSACMNYTNLSVARVLTRAKEIGVRKVTGAGRGSLMLQFVMESVLLSLLALAVATGLLQIIKPAFTGLWINQFLQFDLKAGSAVYLVFVGLAIIIGMIAGGIPAYRLSALNPIKALKKLDSVARRFSIRKVLSTMQFVVSLLFITTSIVIFQQFRHFMTFDYGFTSENVINVEVQGQDYEKLANEFRALPGVVGVSASDIIPGLTRSNGMQLRRSAKDEFQSVYTLYADEHLIPNLDLKLVAGTNVPETESTGTSMVVNMAFVRSMGFNTAAEAIGTDWETSSAEVHKIVGVVDDFRFQMLLNKSSVDRLAIMRRPALFQFLNIKMAGLPPVEAAQVLETGWKKVDPVHPFTYHFYDDQLAATHQGLLDIVSIIGFMAFLAIVIACLGLLGMTTYTAERRRKEVGIRKVLGAPSWVLAFMLSKEFMRIIAISVAIGAPLSYFITNLWLQRLPNRVDLGIGTLIISVLILLLLGFMTVASQTIAASKSNPVDVLKDE